MSSDFSSLLLKGQRIDNKYTVGFFLRADEYKQTYRIINDSGEVYFLDLFNQDMALNRLERIKNITNNLPNNLTFNILELKSIMIDDYNHFYFIKNFKSGEWLSERLSRIKDLSSEYKINIIRNLADKMVIVNQGSDKITNSINIDNIYINMEGSNEDYIIFDLMLSQIEGDDEAITIPNSYYLATEIYASKNGTVESEIFSMGVLLYKLLYSSYPWDMSKISCLKNNDFFNREIKKVRSKGINDPALTSVTEMNLFDVIKQALSEKPAERFSSFADFSQSLLDQKLSKKLRKSSNKEYGFNAIAGMDELKGIIQTDVIDALNNQEKYKEYGLDIPNGLLLYGPPGCGKTFFAEKMAEEVDFNFIKIKPSDIQSKWVNESQENLKKMFEKARKDAPTIIFIDEIDALAPSRENNSVSHMNTSVVNELLAQMNNSGSCGVFIVAATNIPQSIDPALLRTGRFDKKIYVPMPDLLSRSKLFSKILERRPLDKSINFDELANITNKYIASDIKFICDEGARIALKSNRKISQFDLISAIKSFSPSIRNTHNYLPFIN